MKHWNSLPIKRKLLLSYTALIFLFLIGGGIVMVALIRINQSAKTMHQKLIPSVALVNNLESAWQQSIFYMRSYTIHKDTDYYKISEHHLQRTLLLMDSLKQTASSDNKSLVNDIEKEINRYSNQSNLIQSAIGNINNNYQRLDSASRNLQDYSNKYLNLQYKKLKADIDKNEADYIIKRRVDKVSMMSEIVSVTEQIKSTIGEANFSHDYELLDSLPERMNIIYRNVSAIRPMTTKQYDLESLKAIESLTLKCKNAVKQLSDSYKNSSSLTGHSETTKGLELIDELANKTEIFATGEAVSYQQQTQRAQITWWIFLGLIIGAGVRLSVFISRSLSTPIVYLTHIMSMQEKGLFPDIEQLARNDEIGQLTNVVRSGQEKTKALVENLRKMAETIDILINKLHQKSVKLSHSGTTQAVNTEEISASMEEMASLSTGNAMKAGDAVKEIQNAGTIIHQHLSQTKETMEMTQQLMAKTDNITLLASQTYILSLNASIEAARSGDKARGFSVIARNMRELSERVKATAEEMTAITAHGRSSAADTIENIQLVGSAINKSIEMLQVFAEAAHLQNHEITQVNQSIQDLNHHTQQSSLLAEELTDEAARLGKQSQYLHELLEFYQTEESMFNEIPIKQNRAPLEDLSVYESKPDDLSVKSDTSLCLS